MVRILAMAAAAPVAAGLQLPPHCDVGGFTGESGDDLSQTWKSAFGVWCIHGQAVWTCPVLEDGNAGVVFEEEWPQEALEHVGLNDVEKVIFEMTANDPAELPQDAGEWDNATKNAELFADIVAADLGVSESEIWGSTGVGPGYKEEGWSFQVASKDREAALAKVLELGRKYFQGAIYEMVPLSSGAMERRAWPTGDKFTKTVTQLKPCRGPPASSSHAVNLHVDLSNNQT